MACCSFSTPPHQTQPEDGSIILEKRPLQLKAIEGKDECRLALSDWTRDLEASERKLGRKLSNWSRARSDVYQILGLFSVFQGVIITAVAQSNLLNCNHWWLVFMLSFIAFGAAAGATVQKLNEIAEYKEQHLVEHKVYLSLEVAINKLRTREQDWI